MDSRYHIAIVGAGPAGLSAAARAAHYDGESGAAEPSYILLEGFSTFAKTIQYYQKGKHVMAEPGYLDLRSPLAFAASSREVVLANWQQGLASAGVNVRYSAEVSQVTGERGNFSIRLQSGASIVAENVILSIGLQGNPRRLGVAGDDESDFVRYTLADPAEFTGQTIVVVGAGDAAIENAIALSARNTVHIVNRRDEFSRAKDGNLNAVLTAINDPEVDFFCSYGSAVLALELPSAPGRAGAISLQTPAGIQRIECHRVIARLGAIPPRSFVESCGIAIAGDSADAVPDLDRHYQSNVPGLYIVGALAGYPLIKQALNQGYDVVDFIHGKDTRPADYPLIQAQFSGLPYALDADEVLTLYQQRVPMFRHMNALMFRELVIDSTVMLGTVDAVPTNQSQQRGTRKIAAGDAIYSDGEYSNSFYTIVEGEVKIRLGTDGAWQQLKAGQFFGEMSLLSGRPRQGDAIAGADCILIETPRRTMVKLMNSNADVGRGIERVFVVRALQLAFQSELDFTELMRLSDEVELCRFEPGENVFNEGHSADCLHLIRSGTVVLTRGGSHYAVAHCQSGELVGQMALMGDPVRRETAAAVVRVETIRIRQPQFLSLVGDDPARISKLQKTVSKTLLQCNAMVAQTSATEALGFLMNQGLGEATNALVIDEALCVGCDNCERACAETHGGVSRLNRVAGISHAQLQVPVSCRHCELPHCMKDCPTNAIRRAPGGEVFINEDCIGCGNCETNCPYDAIKMSYEAPAKPPLWRWLLFGVGPGPGEDPAWSPSPKAKERGKKAVKCDACLGQAGGPACVRACPTGAAARVSPADFTQLVAGR